MKHIKDFIRQIVPFDIRHKINLYVDGLHFQNYLEERRKFKSTDIFIVSFPKCGRTWIRLMIGKSLITHFNLKVDNYLLLRTLNTHNAAIPRIAVTHDDKTQKKPHELNKSKNKFRDKKVILLVRNPRDVVVSLYFHNKHRERRYNGKLSDFIRLDIGSLNTLIMYYNIWSYQRHVPKDFLLIRYEDFLGNPEEKLQRIFEFINVDFINKNNISETVEWARFDNMRKMERENRFNSSMLNVRYIEDEESYKVRRGKVGGYKEYLCNEDILYMNKTISTNLSEYYWYYKEDDRTLS